MIDPHVHLRDGKQRYKETVQHGFEVAFRASLNGVFEMPNTDPALVDEETIKERIELGRLAIENLKTRIPEFQMFHGIYGGVTNDLEQVKRIVDVYRKNDEVVGLKLFAGNSTGDMGIKEDQRQFNIYETLAREGYEGVLAVHCEKEGLMDNKFDPNNPITHSLIRPENAESVSAEYQLWFAEKSGFRGTLHICHISSPETLKVIEEARKKDLEFKITCGITPHHSLLNYSVMRGEKGLIFKMNPPLRNPESQQAMYQVLLKENVIDWIETDHAPHSITDKMKSPYMSGVPCLPAHPLLIKKLRGDGMSEERIKALTFGNIVDTFGLQNQGIEYSQREPEMNLVGEYEFNVFPELGPMLR